MIPSSSWQCRRALIVCDVPSLGVLIEFGGLGLSFQGVQKNSFTGHVCLFQMDLIGQVYFLV